MLEELGLSNYARIPVAEEKPTYPMSSTQKRMYLLWKFTPQETNYNMPAMFKFDHHLEADKLEQAINKLIEHHEILRTTFAEKESQLVQVISASLKTKINIRELTESEVKKWYDQAIQPFHLEQGSLFRIAIARTPKRDYLFLDMHHIIGDGMSTTIFVNEINTLVAEQDLPPTDRQYKDYSEWLLTQDHTPSENYWLANLEDYPILELPTDYPRPEIQQFHGATKKLILDQQTTSRIKTLIKETQTTEYMFFMALISILLGKIANQQDLIIGSPVSGRIHKDTESMLGMFVNTLAMRLKPEGNKPFTNYLAEIKKATLEAGEHQIYPLEDLVEKIVETRDPSRSPLFDILLVYQNNETLAPLMGSTSYLETKAPAKFDLTFTLSDDGDQTYLDLTYATSLFSEATIKTYLKRLTQLMNEILTQPDQPIKDLNALLPEEIKEIIDDMGNNYLSYPKSKTIVDIFEEQVTANETELALIYNETTLTYTALNQKANQLAHYLITNHNIQPEDTVGLLLDRNEHMIIAILAVLKAGAAYVPVSPQFPQDRITYIEETAEFKLALVEETYQHHLSNPIIIKNLNLETYPTTTPKTNLTPTNLAYMIFTSGTTGKPKGVMIEHHHVLNFVPAMRKGCLLNGLEKETILFSANYVFDASIDQIFSALLSGDRLLIAPEDLWMDTKKFTTYLNDNSATYIQMTTSLLLQLDLTAIPSLKYVISAGESITLPLLEKNLNQPFHLINGYGPTETTIVTHTHPYQPDDPLGVIGKIVQNMTFYILDAHKRPVPKGTIGELYIGGIQVSRGYIKNPELTAQKFIPNPFQTEKQKQENWNDRIYQTGDLVRQLDDGIIEYHGRSDFQIKIRGYRIELGEIEQTLLQNPTIKSAHVIPLGDKANPYLGAYYQSDMEISTEFLEEELAKKLPDYMIPTGYCHMKEFPLTVNGKLDRRALPIIDTNSATTYIAPTTELEKIITTSYQEVLDLKQVGTSDDFFKLGGHSLRALRLINILQEKTGKDIQIQHIFQAPKVSQLVNLLQKLSNITYDRIPVAEEKPHYGMSPSQKRMYRFWRDIENRNGIGNNMPILLTMKDQLDEKVVQKSFEKIVERHEIYRTTFTETDDQLIQTIHPTMPVNAKTELTSEKDLPNWFNQNVYPFDLESGPLYRVKIARTEAHDYLFIDTHHIISDGRSHTNLAIELIHLFNDLDLPPIDRQFKDYSEWFNTLDLNPSETYWLEKMKNYPTLTLPLDHPRPPIQDFTVGVNEITLSEETTTKIRTFIKQTETTEYIFFLALIGILLGKLSSQEDLIIGSPMSGRIHKDLENMLGMIVNSLPMRLTPTAKKPFLTYLQEIKTQTLTTYDHQTYPLDDLKAKLITTPDPSRHALYDILYVYQNNEQVDFEALGVLNFQEHPIPEKLDLNYTLTDNQKQITILLTYATALFKPETIETYQASLKKLIDQILNNNLLTLQDLEI